jgi:hypothetical protein
MITMKEIKEIRLKRVVICTGCPSFNEKTSVCIECNCYIPIKTTLMWTKCPLDKWGRGV